MKALESSWYWWASRLVSYLLLSGLWLLCSAPILTLFPATVALFAVCRTWLEHPDEAFYLPFFAQLRRHFWADFVLGLCWLLGAALLALNLALMPAVIPPTSPLLRALCFGVWLLALLVYGAASVFIFPLRARYDLPLWASVRSAVALGLTQLGTTALGLGAVVIVAALFWLYPATLFVSAVAAAQLISWRCRRTFERLEAAT